MTKLDDVKNRRPIRLSTVNVLRRLNLSWEECCDEITIRRFCAQNQQTLPGMIEVRVTPKPDSDTTYEWTIEVWEQPSLPEEASALLMTPRRQLTAEDRERRDCVIRLLYAEGISGPKIAAALSLSILIPSSISSYFATNTIDEKQTWTLPK